ncbi:MAG TPA: protein kinase, partial [Myxococcota bacterium]|nr:protein kinase [Myxococcota bacterium]
LGDVHRAGILHRDLKPANVRVDPTGALWLIDFGIAAGQALDPQAKRVRAGTPRYLAPECLRGEDASVASDLYAVGVMLRDALGESAVPPEVDAVLTKMMDPDPQQRPPSAGAAAAALGAQARLLPPGVAPQELFAGPRHYLHLPELGEQRLVAESGGDSARYAEVFARWERLGYGRWEQGLFALDRFRLAEWGEEEEALLGAALAQGAAPEWVQHKSLELAQRRLDAGFAEAALLLCERSLELQEGNLELGLLAAEAATRLEAPAAFSRAICLLRRCRPDPLLVEVDLLLQASERVHTGQRREAVPLLDQMLLTLPENLEIWRQAIYLLARRGTEAEEATL